MEKVIIPAARVFIHQSITILFRKNKLGIKSFATLVLPNFLLMIKRYKEDIKTIIQVLLSITVYFSLSQVSWISWLFSTLFIAMLVYNGYFVKYRKDTILFPTLNDESSKMTFISFGVLIFFLTLTGYFAFRHEIKVLIAGFAFGAILFSFGLFLSPKGWLEIKGNLLKVHGIIGETDTRQLQTITLENNKITLTNIYGENKNSFQLKLDPSSSAKIKAFLSEKLLNKEVLVVDNVKALS
jgi:hypothetical protein